MSAKIGSMQTVYFNMVGCRLNQAEIEAMAREFANRGYRVVDQALRADLIVINTCCVTLKAAADSRKMLRHYQTHTSARVIGTGCWNSAFPEQAHALLDGANQITNKNKNHLVDLLADLQSSPTAHFGAIDMGSRQRTRAFVKVQDGCNNNCTYCLTQIARGRSRSESTEKIVDTINMLVSSGTKEVVLTGVQIGSWGKELGDYRIHNLIDEVLQKTKVLRLRLSSIEPWDVTKELLSRFDNPRFCPHLHIPIQSGSDQVLRAMRRPLSKPDLNELFQTIRLVRPNLACTTDIIVGFPGETSVDLKETLDFIESNQFAGGHVFKFSPMPGTEAYTLPNQVQDSIRKARLEYVLALLDRLSAEKMHTKVGSTEDILFEAHRANSCEGYTPDYYRVRTEGDNTLTNTIRKVILNSVLPEGKFEGRLV